MNAIPPFPARSVSKLLVVLAGVLFGNGAARADSGPYDAVDLPVRQLLQRPADSPAKLRAVGSPPRRVRFIRLAGLPDKGPQTLWSSWGDGCLATNRKYYTSIGDHLGVDATSLIFEYNPVEGRLRQVADVFAQLKLQPGDYGHGKIHSGMHEQDGWIYFSTYWGKHRQIEEAFQTRYQGSVLMRLQIDSHRLENWGSPVPRQGLPTSLFDPRRSLLYFYAVYENNLLAYDIQQRQSRYLGGKDEIVGSRAMLLDAQGRVYTSGVDGRMRRYDPASNRLETTDINLGALTGSNDGEQAPVIRAGLPQPLPDGRLAGMTASGRVFLIDVGAEEVVDLGDNVPGAPQYTAVVKASPDGRYLYYAPGAHGSGAKIGAPVMRFDLQKRRAEAIAFLEGPLQERGYQIGGSYNLAVSPDGRTLFATFNGAPLADPSDAGKRKKKQPLFGEPCVLEIQLE